MGATTFGTLSYGKDVKEAFHKAVEQARYGYGHRGYTGTIAEKSSYIVIPKSEHKGKNKTNYAYKLIDDEDSRIDDKWGPSGAIQIIGKKEKELRERYGLKGKKIQIWYFFGWSSK